MPDRIALLTDSTAGLPAHVARRLGIAVIPLSVVIDEGTFLEGVHVMPGDVVEALRQRHKVTTSRPSPGRFLEFFDQMADDGFDHIVCVHLSGELSGTYDAARLAGWESDIPVSVVDTGVMGMAVGRAAMAAAVARDEGADAAGVASAARACAESSSAYLYVDTLQYLWRGGRITAPNAFMGTALGIKPILHVNRGKVSSFERPRSSARALARLVDVLVEQTLGEDGRPRPVTLDVTHVDAYERARTVAHQLEAKVPFVREVTVLPASAVLAVHTGPGMVGVVATPI